MTETIRLGIAGLGTVGTAVVSLITEHADLLKQRTGKNIVVSAVSARNRDKDRGIDLSGLTWNDSALALVEDDNVDAVVELIGVAEGMAFDLAKASL